MGSVLTPVPRFPTPWMSANLSNRWALRADVKEGNPQQLEKLFLHPHRGFPAPTCRTTPRVEIRAEEFQGRIRNSGNEGGRIREWGRKNQTKLKVFYKRYIGCRVRLNKQATIAVIRETKQAKPGAKRGFREGESARTRTSSPLWKKKSSLKSSIHCWSHFWRWKIKWVFYWNHWESTEIELCYSIRAEAILTLTHQNRWHGICCHAVMLSSSYWIPNHRSIVPSEDW